MDSLDEVGITFANVVLNRGAFNNVVNLNLAAYQWSPKPDGSVDPDPALTCRLRMDLACAVQMRDALSSLIEVIEQQQGPITMPGSKKEPPQKKPNGLALDDDEEDAKLN